MAYRIGVYFILLWILIPAGATFVTEYKTTWNKAINNCTIEMPKIKFQGRDEELPVDYPLLDNDVWVGYYLAAAYFHYIGCLSVEGMSVTAKFDHNTPGLCYSACLKKGFIGISEKECYCLNDTDQLDVCKKNCNKGCKDHDDIACGAGDYMSLYSIDSAATLYSGDGECLLYHTKNEGPDFTWSDCTDPQVVICALNDNVQNALNDEDEIQEKGWRESMNICFERSMLPPSIEQLKKYNLSTSSWAGVIKSEVIYSIEDAPITHRSKQLGYLKKKREGAVLKFERDDDTEQKHILCETERKPTTSGPTSGSTTESASDIGVPVGISIAIFLIVVIAVIAVLLLKRRAMFPVICCRMFMSDKTQKDPDLVNNIAYDIPVNPPYDQIDEDAMQQNNYTAFNSSEDNRDDAHTYFVLEKDAENSTTENVITGSKADKNENNVYNTLSSNTAPGDNLGDTYDTAEKVAKRLKDQHDKEVFVEKGSTIGDMDEDAYNHINDARMKKGKTDHVYGVPSDIGNDYGDAKNVHEQDHNVEDAYNHINP
ncbi:uncharacterized protein LOC132742136 isoform X2 [Ruditapes philippinarum]|uniref:uncharacterized protein LOC132742136 isoform X2 n=1 Tax=Ruditapes philippinarum TaxID=129788 RepID=UPI00295BA08C|nr:uncharacterized protein LOC132742136 isoform X2 [Ruditapes philippinarum]